MKKIRISMLSSNNETTFGLIKSTSALFLTFIFISTLVVNPIISDVLIESDVISNGRYAMVYEAHDTISEFDGIKITAVGSSIIRDTFDGICISDKVQSEDSVGVFNLGISGGNPYTEMIQTSAMISSQPDVVVIELGPNNLWEFYESKKLNDYIEFRFKINSITMSQDDIGDWTELIRTQDEKFVSTTIPEQIQASKTYSLESIESKLEKLMQGFPEIDYTESDIPRSEENWIDYLMTPPYKAPNFEIKSQQEVEKYFSTNMPLLVNGSIYKPQYNSTLNHRAYEYMINELTSNNIEILLLGIPHHPLVYDYLSHSQLDGYNSTFENFSKIDGVTGMNMFWEEWPDWMFRDRNHLGDAGREYACERLSHSINQLLSNTSEGNNTHPTIETYLQRNTCSGTDLTWPIIGQTSIIEAEGYSFCSDPYDRRLPHRWEFAENKSIIRASPDIGQSPREPHLGPMIGYNLTIVTPGMYYFWFETRGESSSDDTFAVNFDRPGYPLTNYSIVSSFEESDGEWHWTKQSSLAPLKMWVPSVWDIKINIWMQEDGVEINRILVTSDQNYVPDLEVLE